MMATWTNKQWGAVIGALVLFSMFFGIIGYVIGKYLDGEIDTDDLRARAQGRQNGM
jgi:hypothetical protein